MLDIYFWLRFPLLLRHPAFVAAALEECSAAIKWKQRFAAVSENPNTTVEDLTVCSEEFASLASWIEKETLKVLARTLNFSYSIVRGTWTEVGKIDSFDRFAGLHVILRAAGERCRADLSKLQGAEKESMHRLSSLIDKVLRSIRKRVEELFPGELSRLDSQPASPSPLLTPLHIPVQL